MKYLLNRQWLKSLLVVAAASIILTVPFIDQPFNQDDRDFVEFARASASSPTKLELQDYTYDGRYFQYFRDPHGPLLTTYLGASLRMGATESEALFHGLYLIFPLIGGISMYFLARRFTGRPLAAALLLLFTPGCLVLSHTLMDNLPGLALGLAAMSLYVFGVDQDDRRLLIGSGIAIVLAALTAYQTLSLVPAMLLYGLLYRPRRLNTYLPFFLLLAGGFMWLLATYGIYARRPALSYKLRGQAYQWPGYGDDYGIQLRPVLVTLGGVTVFPLSVLVAFMRRRADLLAGIVILALVTIWVLLSGIAEDSGAPRLILVVLLAWTGAVTVYHLFAYAVAAARQRWGGEAKDALFLLMWFLFALLFYLAVLIPYVSARHLLLLFPPIILLFVKEAGRLWPRNGILREVFIVATLALTLAAGLAAALADYRSASVYPEAAVELEEQLKLSAEDGSTLYHRGEFGFRYYLEAQGFKALNDQSELQTGDIVIFSTMTSPARPWPDGNYTELFRLEPEDGFPVRIWNWLAGAGFYTNHMGSLPIVWSQQIQDRIIAYRFEKP